MAWSTSSLADFWKMPITSRVSAGFRFSKVRPVRVSTHSPAMKFLKILGFATAPMLADVCSIVAIRLSSLANCKPSMLSGGWRLVIPAEEAAFRPICWLFVSKRFREIVARFGVVRIQCNGLAVFDHGLIVLTLAPESVAVIRVGLSEVRLKCNGKVAFSDGLVVLVFVIEGIR